MILTWNASDTLATMKPKWLFLENIVAAFRGMHMLPAKHSYAWLPDERTDRQTEAEQSDPYVPLFFTGDTKILWSRTRSLTLVSFECVLLRTVQIPWKLSQASANINFPWIARVLSFKPIWNVIAAFIGWKVCAKEACVKIHIVWHAIKPEVPQSPDARLS